MKRNAWIAGGVIAAHGFALLLFQGCRTVHSESHGRLQRPQPSAAPLRPAPSMTTITPAPVTTTQPVPVPTLPRPTPREAFPEPTTEYTVQPGDSLSSIAYRFKLNAAAIASLNNLQDPNRIRVGQVLRLPGRVDLSAARSLPAPSAAPTTVRAPAGGDVYEVKAGDTLSGIALRYRVTVAEIKRANNLRDDRIRVGQKFAIPGGETPAVATPTRALESTRTAPSLVPDIGLDLDPLPPPAITPPPGGATDPMSRIEDRESPTTEPGYKNVTVQPGEDLLALAVRWNVSVLRLREINGLTGNAVSPGQVLRVPVDP